MLCVSIWVSRGKRDKWQAPELDSMNHAAGETRTNGSGDQVGYDMHSNNMRSRFLVTASIT
jgi:hypothetical protein